jgi:hypothetical protein
MAQKSSTELWVVYKKEPLEITSPAPFEVQRYLFRMYFALDKEYILSTVDVVTAEDYAEAQLTLGLREDS